MYLTNIVGSVTRLLGLLQRLLGVVQRLLGLLPRLLGLLHRLLGLLPRLQSLLVNAQLLSAIETPSIPCNSCKSTSFCTGCWECLGQGSADDQSDWGFAAAGSIYVKQTSRLHSCQPTKQASVNRQKLMNICSSKQARGGGRHGLGGWTTTLCCCPDCS